jgi:hypothetical protein
MIHRGSHAVYDEGCLLDEPPVHRVEAPARPRRCFGPFDHALVRRCFARYTSRVTIIDWNGADLPAELRNLPAGKYILQRADETLTLDEEQGVVAALESLRAGKGASHDAVRERLLQHVRR